MVKAGDLLAQYLVSDVQESQEVTLLLLELLDQIASGELESWEGTGNAFTLTLTPEGATIQPELGTDTEPRRVSLDDLRDALEDWLARIEK
ncbi:MAG TPA: hypothetical protein VNM67_24715 [Thermoanaerobaculia bacterium]|jgi:hypothetical protein|nr:hypothetical protein [Thermoanaerobaculia bacterium]